MSDPKLATKADLTDFYQRILPYLGNAAAGFTPIGTIIAVFGETAPANYLICDGTAYNKADYPELAAHLLALTDPTPYEVSGDSTKFKVPDLRGEFLRGSGINGHTLSGDGDNVGIHQDPSYIPGLCCENSSMYHQVPDSYGGNTNIRWMQNLDKTLVPSDISKTQVETFTFSGSYTKRGASNWDSSVSLRPTNTSVLFCIATKNITMGGGGGSSMNYSTDEQVVGTWIDGKPLYQKTFTFNTPNTAEVETYYTLDNTVNPDVCFIENGYFEYLYDNGIIGYTPINFCVNPSTAVAFCAGVSVNGNQTNGNKELGMYVNVKHPNYLNKPAVVTIRYTKTTDPTPNS